MESDYSGPTLENGKVTLGFMKDVMAAYKEQKKLHKKYAYQVVYYSLILKLKNLKTEFTHRNKINVIALMFS